MGESDVEQHTIDLANFLKEIQDGIQNRDYVTVADIVEYEMGSAADKWLPALDTLIEHMKKILADESAGQ